MNDFHQEEQEYKFNDKVMTVQTLSHLPKDHHQKLSPYSFRIYRVFISSCFHLMGHMEGTRTEHKTSNTGLQNGKGFAYDVPRSLLQVHMTKKGQ
jgi:hypothetical protein